MASYGPGVQAVYTVVFTGLQPVSRAVHGRVTAVYGPCTPVDRPRTQPSREHGTYTAVHSAVYGPRTQAVYIHGMYTADVYTRRVRIRPCTWPCRRVHIPYTPVNAPYAPCTRPCSRPVHGLVISVYTAYKRPCTVHDSCTLCVGGMRTVVYT